MPSAFYSARRQPGKPDRLESLSFAAKRLAGTGCIEIYHAKECPSTLSRMGKSSENGHFAAS